MHCGREGCFCCRSEGGGDCRAEGVTYILWCEECGVEVHRYDGETGRNACERGSEHLSALEARSEERSVLWLHSVNYHNSRVDVPYHMRVTAKYSTPLDRQVAERVSISNYRGTLMNRRNEMGGVRVERQGYRRWGGD